ncbi:UNVERIFIED_CONTAM: hypothetical protein HDU68_000094 [Siphonaria sp. JEL0065]|nr:hypothetical protein HDU68_000094 [Siphonaria sp. JEL0065]
MQFNDFDDDELGGQRGIDSVTQTPDKARTTGGGKYSFAFDSFSATTPNNNNNNNNNNYNYNYKAKHERLNQTPSSVVDVLGSLFFPSKTPRIHKRFEKQTENEQEDENEFEDSIDGQSDVDNIGIHVVVGEGKNDEEKNEEEENVIIQTISLVNCNENVESVVESKDAIGAKEKDILPNKVACAAEDNHGVWKPRRSASDLPLHSSNSTNNQQQKQQQYSSDPAAREKNLLEYLKLKFSLEKQHEIDTFVNLEQSTLLESLEHYMKTNESLTTIQSTLETQLSTLAKTLAQLESANIDLTSRGQQHSTIWISLTTDIIRLNAEISDLKQTREADLSERHALSRLVDDLKEKLVDAKVQGGQEVSVLHGQIDALESEKSDLLVHVEKLESEKSELLMHVEKLEEHAQNLEGQVEKLEGQAEACLVDAESIVELSRVVQELKEENRDLKSQNEDITRQLAQQTTVKAPASATALTSAAPEPLDLDFVANPILSERNNQLVQEMNTTTTTVDNNHDGYQQVLEETIQCLEEQNASLQDQVDSLTLELESESTKTKTLTTQLSESRLTITTLETKNFELVDQIDTLNLLGSTTTDFQTQIETLSTQVTNLKESNSLVDTLNQDLTDSASALKSYIEDLESEIRTLRSDLETCKATLETTTVQQGDTRKLVALEQELVESQESRKLLDARCKTLESHLERAQSLVSSLEARISELEADLCKCEEQTVGYKKQIKRAVELEKDVKELREVVEACGVREEVLQRECEGLRSRVSVLAASERVLLDKCGGGEEVGRGGKRGVSVPSGGGYDGMERESTDCEQVHEKEADEL